MGEVGIVYATGSKMIRRVVYPDGQAQLRNARLADEDETLLIVDSSAIQQEGDVVLAVETATGVRPADYTCAVVDANGSVTNLVKADPTVDKPTVGWLPLVAEGIATDCTYDAQTNLYTVPDRITPAHTDKFGNAVPEQAVPSYTIAAPLP